MSKERDDRTIGEKWADQVANVLGTWRFIGFQIAGILIWAGINAAPKTKIDPYPYSFLNLILGVQAALTGPILLISGNRQEEIDRKRAIQNLEIDKISYEDLKNISKRIEEQFRHLDGDMEDIKEEIENITENQST
jgi:uncharacterized membrane protein